MGTGLEGIKLKGFIIFINIFLLLLIAGCNTEEVKEPLDAEHDTGYEMNDTKANSISNNANALDDINLRKKEISKKLLNDYKIYISNFEKLISKKDLSKEEWNDKLYNAVMASDKAEGFLNTYKSFCSTSDINWVKEKYAQIRDGGFDSSTIYFGYADSGLHFIALTSPIVRHHFDYHDAMCKVKGSEEAEAFLFNVSLVSDSNEVFYYAVDLFIEDLIEKKDRIPIEMSISDDEMIASPLKFLDNKELNTVFEKYNRSYTFSKSVKSKTWNTYVFDKQFAFPKINIKSREEKIELVNCSTVHE